MQPRAGYRDQHPPSRDSFRQPRAPGRRNQSDRDAPIGQTRCRRAAADVAGEVSQAAAAAASRREAAEQALAAHLQRLAVLEDAAVTAERAAANPPERVPPSPWTCLGNPLHLLMQPDLDADGRALVAAQIGTLARLAGAADELRAQGRAQLQAEQAHRTRLPHQIQRLGNGELGVIPNQAHPDVPTQASPPGPNAGQGFNAPLWPHLGY